MPIIKVDSDLLLASLECGKLREFVADALAHSFVCVRCSHAWWGRETTRPVRCPRCNNTKWDTVSTKVDQACLRCGNKWQSRLQTPRQCPNCKSQQWQTVWSERPPRGHRRLEVEPLWGGPLEHYEHKLWQQRGARDTANGWEIMLRSGALDSQLAALREAGEAAFRAAQPAGVPSGLPAPDADGK